MTTQASDVKESFMRRALAVAQRALFLTDPNPRVGCVLVKDGRIVGEGATSRIGGPHAEVNALRDAGAYATGATAYVTMEPCSHYGRTPPCARALIKAGIARVVTANVDPNPEVSGKGLHMLRTQGIDVICGVLATEAKQQNIGFFKRYQHGLPWVRVKIAASLDGRTAMASGESQWITGSAAREDVHFWRARSSAVVTGGATVRADDPVMTARLPPWEHREVRQPLRVVVSHSADLPGTAKLFHSGPVLVVLSEQHAATFTPETGVASDVEVVELKDEPQTYEPREGQARGVSLQALLQMLAKREMNEIWVEAGATLAGSFIQSGLLDELIVYVAPTLLGAQARPLAVMAGMQTLMDAPRFNIPEIAVFGDDIRLTYRPRR